MLNQDMTVKALEMVLDDLRSSKKMMIDTIKRLPEEDVTYPGHAAYVALLATKINAVEKAIGDMQHNVGDPLTLEQLRGMDGKPVWVTPAGFWALVIAKKGQRIQLICNDGEKVWADKQIELVGPVYACPPAHINLEAWTAEWVKLDGYTECSKCEYWYDSPENEDSGDRPTFCPNCGWAMNEDAREILRKRARGEQ